MSTVLDSVSVTCLTPLKQPLRRRLQRSSIRAPAGARTTRNRVTRVNRRNSANAERTGVVTRGNGAVTSVASDPLVVPIALAATTRKWTVDCGTRPMSAPSTGTADPTPASGTGGVERP